MKMAWRQTLLAVPAGVLISISCTQAAPGVADLSGEFKVIAIRNSNITMAGPHDMSLGVVEPGASVSFGENLHWLWGRSCKTWSLHPAGEALVQFDDPMLSDTQVTAARLNKNLVDHRKNEFLVLRCVASAIGSILRVDDRVLVTTSPSGQSYLVLERVPSGPEVLAVQQALASLKFYEGEPTETMDEKTRRALALFAGYLGAEYDFNASALSNNLLEGLGLGSHVREEPATGWTDESISTEMARLRLFDLSRAEGRSLLVVSGFYETGKHWPGLYSDYERDTNPAHQRLLAIRSFLAGLPNLEYSVLADQLRLLKAEREGDWLCSTSINCYPKGFVVVLGPFDASLEDDICRLFRDNGWFCASP